MYQNKHIDDKLKEIKKGDIFKLKDGRDVEIISVNNDKVTVFLLNEEGNISEVKIEDLLFKFVEGK